MYLLQFEKSRKEKLIFEKWSSRGSPVRLIDCNPSALKSALYDIEKLKITTRRASGHENGIIETFSSDELGSALKDAWLVVEVCCA
jgi:hypothetical protein